MPVDLTPCETVDLGARGRFQPIPVEVLAAPSCDVCERSFTASEWEDRHWWGTDVVHADCCPSRGCGEAS